MRWRHPVLACVISGLALVLAASKAAGVSVRSRAALVSHVSLSACTEAAFHGDDPRADPRDAVRVALGAKVNAQHCAACYGTTLEGKPDWRRRLPNGRLPAPPRDESGHTWHHPDEVVFGITKNGLLPPNAPKDYESDMPAFTGKLSDEEIWAVLAYIKSYWRSTEVLSARQEMTWNVRRK